MFFRRIQIPRASFHQDILNDKVLRYATVVKPHIGRIRSTKGKTGCFIHKKGEISGELRIVRHWHGIGQVVSVLVFFVQPV
jgi:hypothetical protein